MNKVDMILESENETIIEIVNLIGAENTRKLVDAFGGSRVYIPSIETIGRRYRDINIYNDFLAGISYSKLRRKYRLSEQAIRTIINIEREKGRQLKNEWK